MQLQTARRVIADKLKRYPRTYQLAKSVYTKLVPKEHPYLSDFARTTRDVFFVQIGAHDGKTDDELHDFICRHRWKGVLVEPVAYLFNRLISNYNGLPGLAFENKALAESDGRRTFYRLRQSDDATLPSWYDQLGSFDKEVILGHKKYIPDIEKYIIEESVDCISFATLIKAHRISHIDLILIDTEGHDLQILQQIDFSRFSPKVVVYEHKHLSTDDKLRAERLLTDRGYTLSAFGLNDMVAKRRA